MNKRLSIELNEDGRFSLKEGEVVRVEGIPTRIDAEDMIHYVRRMDAVDCDTTEKLGTSQRFIDAGGIYLRTIDEVSFRGRSGRDALTCYFGAWK